MDSVEDRLLDDQGKVVSSYPDFPLSQLKFFVGLAT